jgi:hypothetical protein
MVPLRLFMSWVAYGEWRPSLYLWKFSRRIVGFRTVSSHRATVLFPAGLDERIDFTEVIRLASLDLDDLAQRFGFRLRRRLTIIVVPSHQDLTEDFGRPMGGTVLVHGNAVVLVADCSFPDSLRHELTHLFAARWNTGPPPLIQEGLAVWLQETDPDWTDTAEELRLIRRFNTDPSLLLDHHYFFAPDRQQDTYAMAGVFTGFLLRRFGWDRYRKFYRWTDRWTFRVRFKRYYGMSLEEAWLRCHDESVAMVSLNRRLREDRLFNLLI